MAGQYRQLGKRGPRVSRLAQGNWSAGGDWGIVNRRAAVSATPAALHLGINLFDTARAYGFGKAEELLGRALRPEIFTERESIVIATKGGLRNLNGMTVRDSSPSGLRRDLETSLRALGTDYIDIYQVQSPDPATPIEATAETLDAFLKESLIRYVGVSNYDARDMAVFQRVHPIDTLQPLYHVFRRDIDANIVSYAREHGISILVDGALAHGLLSGRMTEKTTFPPDDTWSASDPNLQAIRKLAEFAARRDATVAQLAIAWTFANPYVDVAIVGGHSAEQLRQTAAGADLELSAPEMTEIDPILHGEIPADRAVPEVTERTASGDSGSRPSLE